VQGSKERTEKSHSGAELLKFIVSDYGLSRYHGRRLVGVLLSDRRFYGNQGGTANCYSSLRLDVPASGTFYVADHF